MKVGFTPRVLHLSELGFFCLFVFVCLFLFSLTTNLMAQFKIVDQFKTKMYNFRFNLLLLFTLILLFYR